MMAWLGLSAAVAAICAICLSPIGLYASGNHDAAQQSVLNFVPEGKAWNIFEHLGGNSPWFPKTHDIVSAELEPPGDCYIDQVHMVCFEILS